ncbi:MAG: hypothetical protein V2A54_09530 [Bacteroidota bacterium]
MKKLLFLFIVITALGLHAIAQNSQASPNEKIKADANKQIPEWLKKIPVGKELSYGFQSRDEFSKATAGDPLSYFTLIKDGLVTSIEFRVPILIDGEYRALLTMQKNGEEYLAVDFGAKELAKDIQTTLKNADVPVSGFVRCIDLHSDFLLMLGSSGEDVLIPLSSAIQFLSSQGVENAKEFYPLSEIITYIK